jgi:hypothetical protein
MEYDNSEAARVYGEQINPICEVALLEMYQEEQLGLEYI